MTRFLLVRHALTQVTESTLIGRLPGISLSQRGVKQAIDLAGFLRRWEPDLVLSSPLERATETAKYISERCSVDVVIDRAFEEFDFGRWTGLTFSALSADREWQLFNARRSFSSAPDGESLHAVQCRAVDRLNGLQQEHAGKTVAIVTHADVIRAVLTYAAGVPIDLFIRFAIDPASVTIACLGEDYPIIQGVNLTAPPSVS
jgi:broad specificity phosphatase PhoE